MAIKANIIIDQGADFFTELDVTDDDGTPIDLSDYTGVAQLRKHYTSLTYFSFSVNINGVVGKVALSMTANTTDTITPGRYVYDCELTDTTNNKRTRIVEGIATVTPQVTR